MADVTYTVEVQYLSKGSLLDGLKGLTAGGGVQNTMNQLNQSISQSLSQSLTQSLSQRFTQNFRTTIYNRAAPEVQRTGQDFGTLLSAGLITGLAMGAIESAVGTFTKLAKVGLIEMNAQVEQLSITMASMFAGSGQANSFSQGLDASAQLMKTMRKDARELPGEFSDLAQIMMRITTPAANNGLSVKETEQLAANAMAIGVGGGMRADVVGRELGELIRGNMSKRMPLLSHLPNFSMDSKEFNAMPMEKRIARLKQALGMMEGTREQEAVGSMRTAFQNSWTGLWSTLKDQAKLFLGSLTSSLFGAIKDVLIRFNEWFTANQDRIESWAKRVGLFLTQGFNAAVAVAERLEHIVQSVGEKLAGRGKESTLMRDLGVGSAAMGSLQVARLAAPAADLTGASLLGGAGAGIAGSTVGLASPLAILTAGVFGIIEGLTNDLGPVFETINYFWSLFKELGTDAMSNLTEAFMRIWPIIKRLAELLGTGMLIAMTAIVAVIEAFTFGINTLAEAFVGALGLIRNGLRNFLKGLGFNEAQLALLDADKKPSKERPELPYNEPGLDLDKLKAPAKPPEHTTHIHRVEIKVNSNQDPNRIAKRTVDIINDLARHPRSYHNSGNPNLSST